MELREYPEALQTALEDWVDCPFDRNLLTKDVFSSIYGIFRGDSGDFVGTVLFDKDKPHLIICRRYRGKWVTKKILNDILEVGFATYGSLYFYINKKHEFMQRMMKLIKATCHSETDTHWIYKKDKNESI